MEDLTIKHKDAIIDCDDCNGTGKEKLYRKKRCLEEDSYFITCRTCLGKGKLLKIDLTILRRI